MKPIRINMDLDNVDPNGVFEDQTLVEASDFILDGVGVSNSEWVTTDGFAKRIGFESTGDISGVTFTVIGYDDVHKHNLVTETVTGPNNSTVRTTNYFYSIQAIAADGAVGTAVEAGPVDEAITATIPMKRNYFSNDERAVGLTFIVTGTVDFTVQQTNDEIQSLDDRSFNWLDHDDSNLINATSSVNGNYIIVPEAMRVKINSYSSGAALDITVN